MSIVYLEASVEVKVFYDHHDHLVPEHLTAPEAKSVHQKLLHFPLPSLLSFTSFLTLSIYLFWVGKCELTINGIMQYMASHAWLLSTQHIFEVHSCCRMCQHSFLSVDEYFHRWIYHILLLFVRRWADIWDVSSCWRLGCYKHPFFFLLLFFFI